MADLCSHLESQLVYTSYILTPQQPALFATASVPLDGRLLVKGFFDKIYDQLFLCSECPVPLSVFSCSFETKLQEMQPEVSITLRLDPARALAAAMEVPEPLLARKFELRLAVLSDNRLGPMVLTSSPLYEVDALVTDYPQPETRLRVVVGFQQIPYPRPPDEDDFIGPKEVEEAFGANFAGTIAAKSSSNRDFNTQERFKVLAEDAASKYTLGYILHLQLVTLFLFALGEPEQIEAKADARQLAQWRRWDPPSLEIWNNLLVSFARQAFGTVAGHLVDRRAGWTAAPGVSDLCPALARHTDASTLGTRLYDEFMTRWQAAN